MAAGFPRDRVEVVLLEGVHPRGVALLEAEGFRVRALPGSPGPEPLAEILSTAHVLGVRSRTRLTGTHLAAAPRLLAVGCFCIGTDQVDLVAARRAGLPVFNAPHGNTRSVAELTIAEVVALHRRLVDRSAACHAGRWDKTAAGSHEVRGRTLGLVGYGHIGAQVSVLAEALGMRVLFYDLSPKQAMGNARPVRALEALLAESDVVSLHVPDTESTRGLIGAAQIARMRPGAMLINNARGGVVDEAALAEALRDGRLAGAALDVFSREPGSAAETFDSPLRGLANVILTPHVGGSTAEAQEAIAADVATKLARFVNNGSTVGAVNVPEVSLPEQGDHTEPGDSRRPLRILHFHRNVPGVLSRINAAVAGLGLNVEGQHLRTHEDLGYVVLDVAPTGSRPVREALAAIEETVRVRMLR